MPHRRLARRLSRIDWLRWELGTVVLFHLGLAAIIALAPVGLVITGATWPIFYYLHRGGMAFAFLLTGLAAGACWLRPRPMVQLVTWLLVYILGVGWLTGFALAVRRGDGGLYGLIVWSVLLLLWGSTAVRLGLGNGGTGVVDKRGRRTGR